MSDDEDGHLIAIKQVNHRSRDEPDHSLRSRFHRWATGTEPLNVNLVKSGYRAIKQHPVFRRRFSLPLLFLALILILTSALLVIDGFRLLRIRYLITACSIQIFPEWISKRITTFAYQTSKPDLQSRALFLVESSALSIDNCPSDAQLLSLSSAAERFAPKFHGLAYQSPMIDTRQILPYPYSPVHLSYPHCFDSSSTLSAQNDTSVVKAALVVLASNRTQDILELQDALYKFSLHVNTALRKDYPAYVIYETTEWTDVNAQLMAPLRTTVMQLSARLRLEFIPHTFVLPSTFMPNHYSSVFQVKRSRFGYQNMCRFWFTKIFSLEPIRQLDYFIRLDSDSYLGSDFKFDPFLYMKHQSMDYAYLHAAPDDTRWTRRLWPFLKNYSDTVHQSDSTAFQPHFQSFHWPDDSTLRWLDEHDDQFLLDQTPHVPQFYNNFEIVRVGMMTENPAVAHFMKYVDETDPFGMLTLRWGDAPLRFITMSMFSSDSKTLMLNLMYEHSGWMIWKHIPPRPISWVSW